MKSKRMFIKIVLTAIFLVQILPLTAFSQDLNYPNIKIIITAYKDSSYKMNSAIYTQGENAFFRIEIKQDNPFIRRIVNSSYIDMPENFVRAEFTSPNGQTNLQPRRIAKGIYCCTSPVLERTGTKNHRLKVTVLAAQNKKFFLLDSRIVAKADCYISVVPLTINITFPQNNSILNTNPVLVRGNLNTEIAAAEVRVNNVTAVVQNGRFTVNVFLQEGWNTLTAYANIRGTSINSRSSPVAVTLDTMPPQVQSITIDEGNITRDRLIHVALVVDGADRMMISEDSLFGNINWESFAAGKEFTLSEGLGEKNIFFKFRDSAGNDTGIISRSITLCKPVSQGPVKVMGRQLFLNNEPYIIKGVTYQPIPVGSTAGIISVDQIYTQNNCDRDFRLLRDMGCNTVRTYIKANQTLLNKANEYGIKVCAGFWVSYDCSFTNQTTRDQLISEFTNYVNQFKNYPSVLIWVIGNEQNAHNGSNPDWYSLANEMARAAYAVEGANYHPVAIVNGDLNNIGYSYMSADDNSLGYIDIWGINVYAGYSFIDNPAYPNYFTEYLQKSCKPLWISEYGIDAYDNAHNVESQKRQAAWDSHAWDEIAQSDVCIGAALMSYSDEWWKAGYSSAHDYGGFSTNNMPHPFCTPDRYLNEEWWGIAAVSDNGSNPDIVIPRLSYYTLKKRWSGQVDLLLVDNYNDGQDPNLLGGGSNVFNSSNPDGSCSYYYDNNENRQCLSILYDVSNINSYAGYYTVLNRCDARPYNNINFYIRGQNGGEIVKMGIRDSNGNEAKINIPEYLPEGITNSWQRVMIPLTTFGSNVNLAGLDNISLAFENAIGGGRGTIYIDDLEFGSDLPSLIIFNFSSGECHEQNALGFSPWTQQTGNSQISYEFNRFYGEGDTAGISVSYAVRGGTYCRLGIGLGGIDVSPYEKLRLSVKGAEDAQKFNLYLEDYWHNRAYVRVQDITTDWQSREISLHPFVFQGVDITNLINLEIVFEWEDRSGTVYLDNIEFIN